MRSSPRFEENKTTSIPAIIWPAMQVCRDWPLMIAELLQVHKHLVPYLTFPAAPILEDSLSLSPVQASPEYPQTYIYFFETDGVHWKQEKDKRQGKTQVPCSLIQLIWIIHKRRKFSFRRSESNYHSRTHSSCTRLWNSTQISVCRFSLAFNTTKLRNMVTTEHASDPPSKVRVPGRKQPGIGCIKFATGLTLWGVHIKILYN